MRLLSLNRGAVHGYRYDNCRAFDTVEQRLGSVDLRGRGALCTEYCGNAERHEYELYLAVENIDYTRTKVKNPQTNGIVSVKVEFMLRARKRHYSNGSWAACTPGDQEGQP